jgi:MFS family permease
MNRDSASGNSLLTPFRVRSFRYQWPADLATSWAFEMEMLILGWYVLVETKSVFMLTVFASLQYIGTLLSPMFGVAGDRIGQRAVLTAMRIFYASLAAVLMVMAFTDAVTPMRVLVIAALFGLVRPSDIGVRTAMVGDIMPPQHLMAAMSVQRTTQDSARITGALTGAGMVATLGMGPAYAVVVAFYLTSSVLTWRAGRVHAYVASREAGSLDGGSPRESVPAKTGGVAHPLKDLREGLAYVWRTPHLLAVMLFAFLLNVTAFPLFNGLMPYVAKHVYLADQTTLGTMVAASAGGALTGSLLMSRFGNRFTPARAMLGFGAAWLGMLLLFAQTSTPDAGRPLLFIAGVFQTMGLIPINTLLIRSTDPRYRGRIMGIRMLVIYGNLPGLLLAGPFIAQYGYTAMASTYSVAGIAIIAWIGWRWRRHLWHRAAAANG